MLHLNHFILQLLVILGAARLTGLLFRRIRQPQVVGEMAAGILLGPSLLGWVAPEAYNFLFPSDGLGFIDAIAQIGLLVFMFLIGLELDLHFIRGRSATVLTTGLASIVLPFALGVGLAAFLYSRLGEEIRASFFVFALFIGTALSVTAFPVLARILAERKLLRTELGALAIACAAINDVAGWMILAVVLLLARAGEGSLPLWATVLGVAVYVGLMLGPLRRLMRRLESQFELRGEISQGLLAFILLFAFASAWMTETLGIHALFGAFVAGAVMPRRPGIVHALVEKLNDFTVVVLLPLFFAYTGLRTSLALLGGAEKWGYCLLIIAVAVAGKYAGSAVPARWTGMNLREAGALGALMNTRGLMELVLLNIGLDIGVIGPRLFAMFVVMALVTTFMTSPLVEWIYFQRLAPSGEYAATLPEVIAASDCEDILAVE